MIDNDLLHARAHTCARKLIYQLCAMELALPAAEQIFFIYDIMDGASWFLVPRFPQVVPVLSGGGRSTLPRFAGPPRLARARARPPRGGSRPHTPATNP